MTFFINKNSELPALKMEFVQNGDVDFKQLAKELENVSISFSMRNKETGVFKVVSSPAILELKDTIYPDLTPEYYIVYNWKLKDTNQVGTFIGEFNIIFHNENKILIAPVRETLEIIVQDSFSKSNVVC